MLRSLYKSHSLSVFKLCIIVNINITFVVVVIVLLLFVRKAMSLCTQKPRSGKSEEKENIPIHRAHSFTSSDRKTERKMAGS